MCSDQPVPTWKKIGCGTRLGLLGLAALTYIAGRSCCEAAPFDPDSWQVK